jgi:hypothetical protein
VSREQLAKRVNSLAKDGRLSAATRTLSEMAVMIEEGIVEKTRSTSDYQATVEAIDNLHPRASDQDLFLPLEREQQEELQTPVNLSAEMILEGVKNLTVGTSSGFSGWTYNAIQAIILPLENQMELCGVVSKFFNLILSGNFKNKILTTSRTILIEKGNGAKRPLGIGEAWYRFLGKTVAKLVSMGVGRRLQPLQLGCGVSGGCEIAGRLAQVILDTNDNMCAIKLDIKNAFNTMPRKKMWEGILEFAPKLAQWFIWAYGEESELRDPNGELVGTSATGCRQGDPLSPLCFSVGLQAVLKEIESMVVEVCRQDMAEEGPCGVIAYIDDTTIFVQRPYVNIVAERISPILEQFGLSLSANKCCILVGNNAELIIEPFFNVNSIGDVIMGAPTGTMNFRSIKVEEMISKMIQPLEAIHLISGTSAFNIIRSCINSRPCYLSRVCDPPIINEGLERFDKSIDTAILQLSGAIGVGEVWENQDVRVPALENASIVRSLPTALGGLGITRHAGIINEKASEKSRKLTKDFLVQFLPTLLTGTELWNVIGNRNGNFSMESRALPLLFDATPPENYLEEQEQDENLQNDNNGQLLDEQQLQEGQNQQQQQQQLISSKAIILAFKKRVAQTLHSQLREENFQAEAAWFISSQFKTSGRWLSGKSNIFFGKYGLLGKDFEEAIRLRLLLPPIVDDLEMNPRKCRCGHRCTLAKPFHLLDCVLSGFYIKERHNKIRDLLQEFIKSCLPEGSVVDKEVSFQVTTATVITADLQYEVDNNIHYIDVTVANPASQSYLNLGSAVSADVASKRKEQEKIRHYGVLGNAVQTGRFIPFAVEATGRLGPAAVQFLQRMAGPRHDLRNRFIDQMNVIMAHHNGQLIANRRVELSLMPPPPPRL